MFKRCRNARSKGYETNRHPQRLMNRAATEAVPAAINWRTCWRDQRMASTRPQLRSTKPEIAIRKKTIKPIDQDPWVLAHRQNSGGIDHSVAVLPVRNLCRMISRTKR